MKAPPEKLGSFFLGSEYDLQTHEITGEVVNYDARDLTTHAVCIGMTGSGKTGLCICMLEEAALDKVPAIIIDPKGDITNHLLHFPNLEASDFEEWINIDDARRKKQTVKEYSEKVAELWKNGLENWGIPSSRILELSNSVDYAIYTPGSSKGLKINIMSSLMAPRYEDNESLSNLITGTTSALLSLIDPSLDPIMSKEGVLLSSILKHYWSRSQDLNLEKIIQEIQKPPFKKLGVFDIDLFYPEDDRIKLAIQLNNLLASPSFSDWMDGMPLDISGLLYSEDGKPKHSIFTLSHLGEDERMFFVTLLLERLSTWMQGQSGTTSLRSIVYFDEVFGYMPPVANPPSKKPLLRILKQGRAFGVGAVLTTQNPVDLDYKGLTNTGTWFIGKLQTERDKNRLLDGLRGANQLLDETKYDFSDIIGSLDSRVFLLHNVHNDNPLLFHTRWAMNYLRGPLTGVQIGKLMESKKQNKITFDYHTPSRKDEYTHKPPYIDSKIEQLYVRLTDSTQKMDSDITPLNPHLLLNYEVRFFDKKQGIDKKEELWAIAPEPDQLGEIIWKNNKLISQTDVLKEPYFNEDKIVYNSLPDSFKNLNDIKQYKSEFSDYLYRNEKFTISWHKELDLYQSQDESKSDFIGKVRQAAREERDEEIDKLERKYDSQLDKINSKIDRSTSKLSSEKEEHEARKREEVFGVGETVLGVLLGRRRTTGLTSASRRRRMTTQSKNKMDELNKEIKELQEEISDTERELREAVSEITRKWENVDKDIEEYVVTPRRTDVRVDDPKIAWVYKY